MNWKDTAEMVRGTKTHSARIAVAATEAIRNGLDELRRQGRPAPIIDEATGRLVQAAVADVRTANHKRKAELESAIAREHARYEADRASDPTHRDETERAIRRYRAMDREELIKASRAMERELAAGPIDPDVIDALSMELKQADPERHQEFRQTVNQFDAYSPWKRTEAGQEIVNELRAVTEATRAGSVPVKTDEGWGNVGLGTLMEGI